ncbi:sialate O-acetylesterase [Akkermansiaceae bacterium]|nr:sialate O-acetylesterase [Akkermansiaceae bacterium]MDB4537960.1 sialate O-acetylesterase [Akkermansiaceae bacterium]
MKLLLFLLSSALLLTVSAEEFEIYLLAGQSNMDGRGQASDLSEAQRAPSTHAIIYYRNPPHSSEGWKPFGPGYSIAPKYKGQLPSPTFGPEIGFVETTLKSQPSKKLALIKGSKGGSSLRVDWNPGEKGNPKSQGPRYRSFIETIELALAALKKDGHSGKIRGLIWHQGESDSNQPTAAHQKRLINFIARIREDVGNPNLPVVLGQVYDNGNRDKVRAAISGASKAVPACGLASAEGTKTWDPGTHFDAQSQLLLGKRFAEEMINLLSGPTK